MARKFPETTEAVLRSKSPILHAAMLDALVEHGVLEKVEVIRATPDAEVKSRCVRRDHFEHHLMDTLRDEVTFGPDCEMEFEGGQRVTRYESKWEEVQ